MMKAITPSTLSVVAFGLLLLTSGCGKSSTPQPPSASDQMKSILKANTWKVQTVTVDYTDQTAVYQGLTLKFTDTNYTSTNGKAVWPASGTWTFTDATAQALTRNDGLEVAILEATSTKLVLSLTWAQGTLGGGRVSSISGAHVFTFGN